MATGKAMGAAVKNLMHDLECSHFSWFHSRASKRTRAGATLWRQTSQILPALGTVAGEKAVHHRSAARQQASARPSLISPPRHSTPHPERDQ